jgi:hypothetical protein
MELAKIPIAIRLGQSFHQASQYLVNVAVSMGRLNWQPLPDISSNVRSRAMKEFIEHYQQQLVSPLDLQPQLQLQFFQVAELVPVLWSQRDASP